MKPWIRVAALLYPQPWRARYGDEFAALLEDVKPDWRVSFDIVKGALVMRATTWNVGRILVVSGMLGALLAYGSSYLIPKTFVSTAVVKITPPQTATGTSANDAVVDQINAMSRAITSRTVLITMINRLGLYKKERSRMPVEDVIDLMRKSIRVLPIQAAALSLQAVSQPALRVPAFVIEFSYPDRYAAQRVTQELVSRYMDENIRQGAAGTDLPITLQLLDPASLPGNPVSPKPILITTMGLGLGLTLGAVLSFVRRRRKATAWERNSTGAPVFAGTDVPVRSLLEYLETDKTLSEFLNDFPTVSREAAVSALEFAKSLVVR